MEENWNLCPEFKIKHSEMKDNFLLHISLKYTRSAAGFFPRVLKGICWKTRQYISTFSFQCDLSDSQSLINSSSPVGITKSRAASTASVSLFAKIALLHVARVIFPAGRNPEDLLLLLLLLYLCTFTGYM